MNIKEIKNKIERVRSLFYQNLVQYVILIPTEYAHIILLKSVKPFRSSIVSNTVTRVFYILYTLRG